MCMLLNFFRKSINSSNAKKDDFQYSQLDITERFDDHKHLTANEWIKTIPLNKFIKDESKAVAAGTPPRKATSDEVYKRADYLSHLRIAMDIGGTFESVAGDGVYCPICHIANIDLQKLGNPCPQCSRPLLRFGWN